MLGARQARAVGAEQAQVDAARPPARVPEAAGAQVVHDGRRGRQRAQPGVVEAPQQRIAPGRGQARARVHVLGKAAVVRSGERPAARAGHRARQPAQRPLGGDMQAVGREGIDAPRDAAARGQRQLDLGVAGAGHAAKALRRQQLHLVPELLQLAARHLQRADHAVDLRFPGVGDDHQLHAFSGVALRCGAGWAPRLAWRRCSAVIAAVASATRAPKPQISSASGRPAAVSAA
ncbi:hypothetical protein Y694_03786 [Methylibium sp. T29-B]|nr:hypothetical protein Y694_03786 [Methylibium sp. T29-B]